FLAVGELDELGAAFDAQAADLLRGKNFHAETASLCDGASSEIGAAKAGRKAEIIFDARAHAGLTAGSFALDHDRGKSFGRSVNGSREPRGSSAYDEEIIERCSCVGTQTEFCGKVGLRRIGKRGAVLKNGRGQRERFALGDFESLTHFFVAFSRFHIEP